MSAIFKMTFQLLGIFGSLFIVWYCKPIPEPWQSLVSVLLGIFITNVYVSLSNASVYLKILPKLIWLTVLGRPLRISFATLIKIQVDGSYLLIPSKRTQKFQPAGGVLRFFDKTIRTRFCLQDDQSYQGLKDDEFRLRFQKGRLFYVFGFLKWFDSQKGREIDPHREFYEELIDTNILDPIVFAKPQFEYLKRVIPPIKYGTHFKVDELFIFEIFELVLNDQQKNFLRSLQKQQSPSYTFLTADQIERDGFSVTGTTQIGSQTSSIL